MEDYKCTVNYLSDPVDVYSEWIDACEEANKEEDWSVRLTNWGVTEARGRAEEGLSTEEEAVEDEPVGSSSISGRYQTDHDISMMIRFVFNTLYTVYIMNCLLTATRDAM